MRRSKAIIGIVGAIACPSILFPLLNRRNEPYWEVWGGEWVNPTQRAFARRCIRFGQRWGNRGHTLASLAWNESSLGASVKHMEESYGPFGISTRTAYSHLPHLRGQSKSTALRVALEEDFEFSADIALEIFNGNYRLFLRKGYRNGMALVNAAKMYNMGNNWRRAATYGHKFQSRVSWLIQEFPHL